MSNDLLPLDLALLRALPLEGEMSGFSPLALQVGTIRTKPGFDAHTGAEIGGRLRSLQRLGYARSLAVQPLGGGAGWQRTKAGEDLLKRQAKEDL